MKFGPEPTADCAGAILAHGYRLGKKGALKKGHVLGDEDLALLIAEGISEITVARLEPGDVGEMPSVHPGPEFADDAGDLVRVPLELLIGFESLEPGPPESLQVGLHSGHDHGEQLPHVLAVRGLESVERVECVRDRAEQP